MVFSGKVECSHILKDYVIVFMSPFMKLNTMDFGISLHSIKVLFKVQCKLKRQNIKDGD